MTRRPNQPPEELRVRRLPRLGHYDRASINAILDDALVGHVAFVDGEQPLAIPFLQARIANNVLIHGSTASRAIRALGSGARASLTVTILDGLVAARSAFEHSANYRSVTVHGRFRVIDDPTAKVEAFRAFTNKLIPGRWEEVREPSPHELRATTILAIALDHASAKIRTGPPTDDDSDDAARAVWAGEIPITTRFEAPIPSPRLAPMRVLDPSLARLVGRG